MKNIKNTVYGVISSLIAPILMLLTIPIFLNHLGVEGYATWVLINSVIASLSVFNFGGSNVIIKFVSSCRGEASGGSAGEVFSTVFAFQLAIILIIYILFLIIDPLVSQHIVSDNLRTFVSILYIAIPIFLIKQSEQLLYAFFKGYEQFKHIVIASSASQILFFSTQALIAIFTKSVTDVFYGALIVSVLSFLAQVLYIKIIHKDNIFFGKVNIKTAKFLLNFGGWNWLSSIVFILKSQSDKWLVIGLLGLKTFGFYSIGILILNQLYAVISSSIQWVFPEIAKNILNKDVLVKKYWRLLFFICVVSLVISFTLSNLSVLFQLWIGGVVYQNSQYYIDTFLLLIPIFMLNEVSLNYLLGLGLVKHKFFSDVASLVAKVVTIYLVIAVFNIEEWVLFFMVFIAIEFIAYAIIISRNLPISFTALVLFLLFHIMLVFMRV